MILLHPNKQRRESGNIVTLELWSTGNPIKFKNENTSFLTCVHKSKPVWQIESVDDVEHEPRSAKIPDRVFSVCVWGVNAWDLETRFEEERGGWDVSWVTLEKSMDGSHWPPRVWVDSQNYGHKPNPVWQIEIENVEHNEIKKFFFTFLSTNWTKQIK